jgi:hypothetical protein
VALCRLWFARWYLAMNALYNAGMRTADSVQDEGALKLWLCLAVNALKNTMLTFS